MQVDPIKPTLKAPVTECLKLKYEELLSNFGSKFDMRRYSLVREAGDNVGHEGRPVQVEPRLTPGCTQDEPRLNPGCTQVEPRLNPGCTQVEPRLNPGCTRVDSLEASWISTHVYRALRRFTWLHTLKLNYDEVN